MLLFPDSGFRFRILTTTKNYHAQQKIEKELGRGSFGIVYLATWRHQKVAVKTMQIQDTDTDQFKDFTNEVTLMKSLRPHNNVVGVLGVSTTAPLCIVTEYVAKGKIKRTQSNISFQLNPANHIYIFKMTF